MMLGRSWKIFNKCKIFAVAILIYDYEATYDLMCLLSELWAKNVRRKQQYSPILIKMCSSFLPITRKVSTLGHMLHFISCIQIWQLRTFCTYWKFSTTFLKSFFRYLDFCSIRRRKITFWSISQKLSTIEHMLLHNTNINVAIAHILTCCNSLYDLHKPRYKFSLKIIKNIRRLC